MDSTSRPSEQPQQPQPSQPSNRPESSSPQPPENTPRMTPEAPHDPNLYEYRSEPTRPMKKFIIIGIVVAVALVALWANRSYYFGPEKPPAPDEVNAGKKQVTPELIEEPVQTPKRQELSPTDKYAALFVEEMRTAIKDFFQVKDRLYLCASPAQYRESERQLNIMPGHAFDITNRIKGFRPELLFRERPWGAMTGLGAPHQPPLKFVSPDRILSVEDKDIVFGVTNGKVAKAYSLKILNYHEIVNDTLGETPIALFWSPFCYLATAFVRKEGETTLAFDPSGRVYFGLSVPYDLQTESLWNPLTGEAMAGEKAGTKLTPIAVTVCTWAAWKKAHPNTLVLSEKSGIKDFNYFLDIYRDNEKPERNYFRVEAIWFPAARFDPGQSPIPPKSQVLLISNVNPPVAVPLSDINISGGKLTFDVDGKKLTFVYDKSSDHAYVTDETDKEVLAYRIMWFACKGFLTSTRLLRPPGLPTENTPAQTPPAKKGSANGK